jgi:hypothetical protein
VGSGTTALVRATKRAIEAELPGARVSAENKNGHVHYAVSLPSGRTFVVVGPSSPDRLEQAVQYMVKRARTAAERPPRSGGSV